MGEGSCLSDLTQLVSLLAGSEARGSPWSLEALPPLSAACLLSPTEPAGEDCTVPLDMLLSPPSGTGWMTPLWTGGSAGALEGMRIGMGMGMGTGMGTMMGYGTSTVGCGRKGAKEG